VYLLLVRVRLKEPQDLLLVSWFLTGILLPYVPFLRGAEHFYNGYAVCIGLLLARRLAIDPQIRPIYERYRPRFKWAAASLATVTALCLVAAYVQIWKDGSNPDPFLISAVRPKGESKLLDWMKQNLGRSLVISPLSLAPWVAAVPRPSLASHDIMTIGFEEQAKLVDRFYKGEDVEKELISKYPIRYIVVPEKAHPALPAAAILLQVLEGYRIYEVPIGANQPQSIYP
jgi:hypothetical protein